MTPSLHKALVRYAVEGIASSLRRLAPRNDNREGRGMPRSCKGIDFLLAMTTGRTSLVYTLDTAPKVCELMHPMVLRGDFECELGSEPCAVNCFQRHGKALCHIIYRFTGNAYLDDSGFETR